MTEIAIKANNMYFRWQCDFCRRTQEKDGMEPELGEMSICRDCLEAGPDVVIERVKNQARLIREHADFLERCVPDLIRSVDTWKTEADYDAVYQAREAEIKKWYEAEVFGPDAPGTQELLEQKTPDTDVWEGRYFVNGKANEAR